MIAALAFGLAVSPAFPQAALLQSGPITQGHAPIYAVSGTQPVVQDSGSAAGGRAGVGFSEFLIAARGTGAAPFAGQGSGPLGTIDCEYDAPVSNTTGYHFLCFSPNAQGGGLLAYAARGGATSLPLTINVNGVPFTLGGAATGGALLYNGGPAGTPSSINLANATNLPGSALPAPTATVLGGVFAATAPANQFQTGVSTTGAPLFAQPSIANIGGLGSGVATLLGGTASGSGGPAGSVSPALTGTPTAPTQTAGDATTALATDAFVQTKAAAALPNATTSQIYAGSGAAGVASVASLGSALSISGSTLNCVTATVSQLGCASFGAGLTVSGGAVTPTFGTAANQVAQGGVIAAGGPIGSATVAPIITYNAAGQLTAVSSATIAPAVGSVTGLGANVATLLGGAATGSGGPAGSTSPALTGTPTAPTATAGVSTTQIATTAFVATAVAGVAANAAPSPQGRLTLSSGTPVMTGNVGAAATVYFTPYVGSSEPLWNGAAYLPVVCGETSNVLANSATGNAGPAAAVASSLYDLFVWNNGGVCTLTRGPAWTNTTTRSLAVTRQSGLLANASAITNGPASGFGLYVGTIATDSAGATVSWTLGSSAAGGGAGFLDVWNEYNRVSVTAAAKDTNSVSASNSSVAACDSGVAGGVGNRVTFVIGQSEDDVWASQFSSLASPGTTNVYASLNIGLDSSSTYAGNSFTVSTGSASVVTFGGSALYDGLPGIGQHYLQCLSATSGATYTFNSLTLTPRLRM